MLPEGFQLIRGWGSSLSLAEVRDAITWEARTIRMYGKEIVVPRLTAWMGGESYSYSGIKHDPTPTPHVVRHIQVVAEHLSRVRFNSVLANLYRDGSDSVAWHSDDEPELGPEPVIASLSLGASRTFAIRRTTGARLRYPMVLHHGDLLIMSGRSQLDYQHAIPKTTRPVGERINLTFRTVRPV